MSIGDFVRSMVESRIWRYRVADYADSGLIVNCGTSTHVGNTYTIAAPFPISSIGNGNLFLFIADATNTGAVTLVLTSGGTTIISAALKQADGSTALAAGDIQSGYPITVRYNGSTFTMVSNGAGGSFAGLTGTGLVAKISAFAYAARTLIQPSVGFSISNADGVAGNPTFALAGDLNALANLSTFGIAVRTSASNWATRQLQGTADVLNWTNSDGTVGNPLIDLSSYVYAGWLTPGGATWTYASATTITTPAGGDQLYAVGDKLWIVGASGTKYFYVIGVTSTVLTITGGSDYALVNEVFILTKYSHAASPMGFPQGFNYSPSFGGFSANPTVKARFTIVGRRCFVNITITANGTSSGGGAGLVLTYSLPVTAFTSASMNWLQGGNQGTDAGAYQNNVLANISSGGTTITTNPQGGSANWTAGGAKGCSLAISYEI